MRDYIEHTAGHLHGPDIDFPIAKLRSETSFGAALPDLIGRSVLVMTATQLTTAIALIELDGLAHRLTILPPDFDKKQLQAIMAAAEIDAVVFEAGQPRSALGVPVLVECGTPLRTVKQRPAARAPSQWVLLTSGTTGVPKLVLHDLKSLSAAITGTTPADGAKIWGTFYDIRRYGGLQILLRAIVGGASFVLSCAGEPVSDHLCRLGRHGVTHISGTPSHWRRVLMNPRVNAIAPRYVRLSGEIADQTILDALRVAFPYASVGHAFASTEAGVAFDVNDGLAGFPASYIDDVRGGVEMKVLDGSLAIRSPRIASRYVGRREPLADSDGFIDTGDVLERRGDRYFFVGRKSGIINVGGLKIHPEEVEAVINQHPRVRMSLVHSRRSPITGVIVSADVVLKTDDSSKKEIETHDEIIKLCRRALPRHKVPATIRFMQSLAVAPTGKLVRPQR